MYEPGLLSGKVLEIVIGLSVFVVDLCRDT